jgi:hypothetical protein
VLEVSAGVLGCNDENSAGVLGCNDENPRVYPICGSGFGLKWVLFTRSMFVVLTVMA